MGKSNVERSEESVWIVSVSLVASLFQLGIYLLAKVIGLDPNAAPTWAHAVVLAMCYYRVAQAMKPAKPEQVPVRFHIMYKSWN